MPIYHLWNDADVGNPFDDLVGLDLPRNLGYVYNGDNEDEDYVINSVNVAYGAAPPAVGMDVLYGALGGAVEPTSGFFLFYKWRS